MVNLNQYRAWIFIKRAIPAVIIFYLFLMSIMVGTAQQGIVEGLKAASISYDYSVAIRHYRNPNLLASQQTDQAAALDGARAAQGRLQIQLTTGERDLTISFRDLDSQVSDLARGAGCPLPETPASGPASAQTDRVAALAAVMTLVGCARSSENAPVVGGRVSSVQELAGSIQEYMSRLDNLRQQLDTITATVNSLSAKQEALSRQAEQAARASDVLAVLEIFRDGRWPMANFFITMPPALMGIVISFTSGLFGALLVTLILIVYPNQKGNLTASETYWERLFVGGLVALSVFVVLFSGVAVLNNSNGTAISQNVMAYAAIGILSGMFSDRAAGWLARQDVFASSGGGGNAGSASRGGGRSGAGSGGGGGGGDTGGRPNG